MADNKISGWLVYFSGPDSKDLCGDYFTKETDFDLDARSTLSVFFDHGMDPRIRRLRIGTGQVKMVPQRGVWIDSEPITGLPKKFWDGLRDMAAAGELCWSSGATGHLVEREADGLLSMWPLAEASLTVQPAEPRARATASKSSVVIAETVVKEREEQWFDRMKVLQRSRVWLSRELLKDMEQANGC